MWMRVAGWVLTASLVGVLAGSPLLGYVGDRYGRQTAILIGSVIYGVTTLAVIWEHSLLGDHRAALSAPASASVA